MRKLNPYMIMAATRAAIIYVIKSLVVNASKY